MNEKVNFYANKKVYSCRFKLVLPDPALTASLFCEKKIYIYIYILVISWIIVLCSEKVIEYSDDN